MKLNFFLLFLVVTLGLGWTFYYNQKPLSDSILSDSILKQAPPFTYQTLAGDKGALDDHKGRVTLIHFWATWCAPCLAELPTLIDFATAQRDLTVLAVAVNDKPAKIDRFLKKVNKTLPDNFIIALDPDKDISEMLFGTVKLPESYLLTPQHGFSRKIIGAEENWNSDLWKNRVESLAKSE